MMLATQYAKALEGLLIKEPSRVKEFAANIRTALARRGHERLLPQITAELEKLSLAHKRIADAREITPERERTRILFELYKKLTAPGTRDAHK